MEGIRLHKVYQVASSEDDGFDVRDFLREREQALMADRGAPTQPREEVSRMLVHRLVLWTIHITLHKGSDEYLPGVDADASLLMLEVSLEPLRESVVMAQCINTDFGCRGHDRYYRLIRRR
jgi:hypothetical protein